MELTAFFYEKGLEVRRSGNEWYAVHSASGQPVKMEPPGPTVRPFGLRPLMSNRRFATGEEVNLLLTTGGDELFDLCVTEIRSLYRVPHGLQVVESLVYILGALAYHSSELCRRYAAACATVSRTSRSDPHTARLTGLGYQSKIYFEFDALVTAVRRAYDSLRFPLWLYFGPGKGTRPTSLYKTLPLCDALPEPLAARMIRSWENTGKAVTEYRHCIQHYSPVDFDLSLIHMDLLDNDIWTVTALIPDNPAAQGRQSFTFESRIDALAFGWEASNEVLSLARAITQEILHGAET